MKNKFSPAWISVTVIVVLWQIAASRVNNPALFPSVTQLLGSTFELVGTFSFYNSLLMTVGRACIAFFLTILLALPASVIAHHYPFWKSFFQPLVVILRSIPVIAIVLIALLYLSPVQLPFIIASITMFPIVYQNFLSAWEQTDSKWIEMAKVYKKNNWQRFRYIYFLQSKSLLFAGLATATGFGWRAIIIGEVMSGPIAGIGTSMKKSQAYIDMPGLLTWTLVAIGGGFLIEAVWKKLNLIHFRPSLVVQNSISPTHHSTGPELILQHLHFAYDDNKIISNFSLRATAGQIFQLKTVSGSGKTTLLNLLSGVAQPTSGVLQRHNIFATGYVFQDLRLLPALTVEQNIAFSLPGFPGIHQNEKQKLDRLLEVTKLTEFRSKLPGELSGGEQQRVNVARALIINPDLLLLDEPLVGLDSSLKKQLLALLQSEIECRPTIVVWATHDETDTVNLPLQTINQLLV